MSPVGCLRFYSKVPLKWINRINAEYLSSAVEFCLERSRCCFSVLEVRVTKLLNGQANKYIKKVLSTNTEKHLKVITCMYQSTHVCLQFLYSEFVLY